MNYIFLKAIVISALIYSVSCSLVNPERDVIYQTSVINALLAGDYDGEFKIEQLKHYGDFGIGTFNELDGEMVALEGKFFQVKADGVAYPVSDWMKTPFAVVTFFEADQTVNLEKISSLAQLEQSLDQIIGNQNLFYAIRMEGTFEYLKTRSVPKQSKPYPALTEAVKTQSVFEFHNSSGVLVGFRSPDYLGGINVAGYHFHFLNQARDAGGHLLECKINNARVEIDRSSKFFLVLPEGEDFAQESLPAEIKEDLKKVEK